MKSIAARRVLVSAILAVVILGLGYWIMDNLASRPAQVRQMSFQESIKQVRVSEVSYQSREIALSTLGRVVSANAADLISEVQGEIKAGNVPLKRGQSFRKGAILFKVDDTEARLSLYAEKSNFITAIAGILPDLKLDFPAAYPLWQTYFDGLSVEEDLPDLPEIKGSQEKVFFSTRNILNQFYNLKSTEERLGKYTVKAPFSGSFLDVLQEVNTVTNPGNRVARIARSSSLELEAPLSREDLEYVQVGMAVDVLPEEGGAVYKGRINRIGAIMDANTQSVKVFITFSASKQRVFEGQYLRIEIPGTRLKDVMEISRKAVINQNQVYVVNDSSRLEIATVQIEKITNQSLFFSGLPAGQQVVNEPLFNAYENMPVSIQTGSP